MLLVGKTSYNSNPLLEQTLTTLRNRPFCVIIGEATKVKNNPHKKVTLVEEDSAMTALAAHVEAITLS